MKKVVKRKEESGYLITELTEEAKRHALDSDAVAKYVADGVDFVFNEDVDGLKDMLDFVECKLTRFEWNGYGSSSVYVDVELTGRGEDMFSIEGLDANYHIDIPNCGDCSLFFVSEGFKECWDLQLKSIQDDIDAFNNTVDDFIASNPNAEDALYYGYYDVPEIEILESKLNDLAVKYVDAANKTAKQVAHYIVEDCEYVNKEDNVIDLLLANDVLFDVEGNIL